MKNEIANVRAEYIKVVKREGLTQNLFSYQTFVYVPEIERLTGECEAIGHVNLETITRDDEERTRYYLCDECGKQIELGPTPQ